MHIRFSMYKLLTGILILIWRMTGLHQLTALTKIKFVEKYIPRMNAGLEKATPSAMPVQPRTRAGLTCRHQAKQWGRMPCLIFVQTYLLYKFVSHTLMLTHKLVTLPPILGGAALEANQGASVHAAGMVYDPGGVWTSYGRLDKVWSAGSAGVCLQWPGVRLAPSGVNQG